MGYNAGIAVLAVLLFAGEFQTFIYVQRDLYGSGIVTTSHLFNVATKR